MSTDFLFQVGWLLGDSERRSTGLRMLSVKAQKLSTLHISENDTKAIFLDTLIRGLGWDTLDEDQVNRESQRGWAFGDIQLLGRDREGKRKVASVIEVKCLDTSDLGGAYSQLKGDIRDRLFTGTDSYNQGVRLQFDGKLFVRAVVTNGARWTIYDFDPTVIPFTAKEHKPLVEFRLESESEVDSFIRALGRVHLLEALGLSAS